MTRESIHVEEDNPLERSRCSSLVPFLSFDSRSLSSSYRLRERRRLSPRELNANLNAGTRLCTYIVATKSDILPWQREVALRWHVNVINIDCHVFRLDSRIAVSSPACPTSGNFVSVSWGITIVVMENGSSWLSRVIAVPRYVERRIKRFHAFCGDKVLLWKLSSIRSWIGNREIWEFLSFPGRGFNLGLSF